MPRRLWLAEAVFAVYTIAILCIFHRPAGPTGVGPTPYDQLANFALVLDRARDRAPAAPAITSIDQVLNWEHEIVPYFGYEGILDPTDLMTPLVVPPITFEDYSTGDQPVIGPFHILGQTRCLFDTDRPITLNIRDTNPASTWYGRSDILATLTHELAHAEGVCIDVQDDPIDAESSAQLVALEIMAAMVESGNTQVLRPLLDEMVGMAVAGAEAAAYDEGRMGEWWALQQRIDPANQDRVVKSQRHWASDHDFLIDRILRPYNEVPMLALLHAVTTDEQIPGVLLPINWIADSHNYMEHNPGGTCAASYSYPGCVPEGWVPTFLPTQPLLVDDLSYLLHHLDG